MDPELFPWLRDPGIVAVAGPVMSLCTLCPRDAVEDAKSGYTEPFEAAMGTEPAGCLMKVPRPVCDELSFCPSADPKRCSTRHRTKRDGADFPMCWTYSVGTAGEEASTARGLVNSIVGAWREGRLVVIVGPRSS